MIGHYAMTRFVEMFHEIQESDRYEQALYDLKEKVRTMQPGEKWTIERCHKGSAALFIVTMVRPAKDGPDADPT